MKRNMEIDSLRALGIFCVMVAHLVVIMFPHLPDMVNSGFGTTIIDLSFVCSGYAISFVLLNQIDEYKANTPAMITCIKSFLVRRVFRIYPSLWAVFLLVWIASCFAPVESIQYVGLITPDFMLHNALLLLSSTYNFLFLHGLQSIALAPFWSLTIEEQFYLTFPFFLILTRDNRQRVKILIASILLITFVLRPITISHYGLPGIYFTQSRCDGFFYGILIFILTQQPWFDNLKPSSSVSPYFSLLLVTLLIFVIFGVGAIGVSGMYFIPISTFLCTILVFLATLKRGLVIFPHFIQKNMNFFAVRSYTLYVLHMPAMLYLNFLLCHYTAFASLPISARMTCLFILTIFVNEPLYRLVLLRYMKKGRQLSDQIMLNTKN